MQFFYDVLCYLMLPDSSLILLKSTSGKRWGDDGKRAGISFVESIQKVNTEILLLETVSSQ